MLSRMALCINYRSLPKTRVITQIFSNRSMHITHRINNTTIKINSNVKISRYTPLLSSSFIRTISNNSDGPSSIDTNNINSSIPTATDTIVNNVPIDAAPASLIDNIPDAPLPPTPEILDLVGALNEPTLSSLGLGGWTPIGIAQQLLELVHVSCGIPWWATITLGTIAIRTILFPLVLVQQRNVAKLHNVLPGMQKIQSRISEARTCGDHFAASKYTQELMIYMKENNCSPFKSMLVPLVQAPIFISFFFGLKRMANLPVESMSHGGLFWFTNLTVTDPYYILPIITSATLALTIKLGVDGPKLNSMGMIRYVIQAIPLVILPFTINFPAAIVWYWVSTNIISLIQVSFLKVPKIREYFNIPQQISHKPDALQKQKNFKEGFKESWTNMKLAREMTDRQQLDNIQFNKAGRGPIPKTYVYNPMQDQLKQSQSIGKRR